jgi:uncharacterized membrane protein YobD (UPF0266 family)
MIKIVKIVPYKEYIDYWGLFPSGAYNCWFCQKQSPLKNMIFFWSNTYYKYGRVCDEICLNCWILKE